MTFTFSDDGLRLTADKWVMTNSNATEAAPYEILTDVVLTKVVERAGKPATPQVVEFQDWNALFEYGLVGGGDSHRGHGGARHGCGQTLLQADGRRGRQGR
ncbi:MAG: hypothetical protein IJ762_02065 [Bacteroidaceae bacterium]|nr:hypothetical protein [Bacteroidaceae bacterium]